MDYRLFGDTGVMVSRIAFGTMSFGHNQWGAGNLEQPAATEMVATCLDAGVNLFDTADVYAYGEAEQLLGKALGPRRHEVLVATKVRGRMSDRPNDVGLSRLHILESVDASLRRLGTDYIDLYQLHGWDPLTPLEETLQTLDDLVRWGKVRYVGTSNFAAWQLARALGLSAQHGWQRFASLQANYSLTSRDLEHELLPLCQDAGLGVMIWSPLAGGFLSGKYTRETPAPADSRLSGNLGNFIPTDREQGYRIIETLQVIARQRNTSIAAIALAWVASRAGVSTVLVGATRMEQLQQNLAAAQIDLTVDEIEQLDAASAKPLPYPQWMIAAQALDR